MSFVNQPTGTIISSILNYDQLCKVMLENPAVNNTTSSYAPCDGRSIIGSQLAGFGIHIAPDLRGKFVRGINQFYSVDEPGGFEPKETGDPELNRNAMSYQADAFKSHHHQYKHYDGTGGQDFRGTNYGLGSSDTSDTGGDETRPRNIAVYFYIKIN
jgi:hypothetical protein